MGGAPACSADRLEGDLAEYPRRGADTPGPGRLATSAAQGSWMP